MRLPLRLIGLLLLLALPGLWTAAQNGYPEPVDTHINDFANVLPVETENRLRALLADLKAEKDIEIVVVTLGWMENYDAGDTTIEAFATNLFNTWGIGSGKYSNGVLLLAAIDDRKVRIEVGSMYENILDKPMQGIINEFILPFFRDGDYVSGIEQGVRGIYHQMTGQFPAQLSARPTAIPSTPARSTPGLDSRDGLMGLLMVAGVLITLGSWVWRMMNDEADSGDSDPDYGWHSTDNQRPWWNRDSSRSRGSSFRRSSSSWSGSRSSSSGRRHGGGRSSGGGASGSW